MFGSLGFTEIAFILILALLLFGPKKLPEIGKTLGKGLAEFRRASNELKRTLESEVAEEERAAHRSAATLAPLAPVAPAAAAAPGAPTPPAPIVPLAPVAAAAAAETGAPPSPSPATAALTSAPPILPPGLSRPESATVPASSTEADDTASGVEPR